MEIISILFFLALLLPSLASEMPDVTETFVTAAQISDGNLKYIICDGIS
jgi:hypothetical protein